MILLQRNGDGMCGDWQMIPTIRFEEYSEEVLVAVEGAEMEVDQLVQSRPNDTVSEIDQTVDMKFFLFHLILPPFLSFFMFFFFFLYLYSFLLYFSVLTFKHSLPHFFSFFP